MQHVRLVIVAADLRRFGPWAQLQKLQCGGRLLTVRPAAGAAGWRPVDADRDMPHAAANRAFGRRHGQQFIRLDQAQQLAAAEIGVPHPQPAAVACAGMLLPRLAVGRSLVKNRRANMLIHCVHHEALSQWPPRAAGDFLDGVPPRSKPVFDRRQIVNAMDPPQQSLEEDLRAAAARRSQPIDHPMSQVLHVRNQLLDFERLGLVG